MYAILYSYSPPAFADGVIVLNVDLRDAVGDRLYLSDGFRRDGVSPNITRSQHVFQSDFQKIQTLFDIGQAQRLQ